MGDALARTSLREGDALALVDVQNDFCPGGALAVHDGDAVVPKLNQWIASATRNGVPVFASQDWHPAGHVSFAERGGPWPPHCIRGTEGAELHPDLVLSDDVPRIRKASDPDRDAYSAFDGTGLAARLLRLGVRRVVVGGLATDYCVLQTVLDAREAGFDVVVIEDAIRAVDAETGRSAVKRMQDAGAIFVASPPLEA